MAGKGRKVALCTAVLGLIVLGVALLSARDHVASFVQRSFGARGTLRPHGGFKGERVDIAPGTIEVDEFFRFLGDYTGLPVIYDSSNRRIANAKIQVAAPMEDADAEVVRALLEANGLRVTVDDLPGGKQVLRIEAVR